VHVTNVRLWIYWNWINIAIMRAWWLMFAFKRFQWFCMHFQSLHLEFAQSSRKFITREQFTRTSCDAMTAFIYSRAITRASAATWESPHITSLMCLAQKLMTRVTYWKQRSKLTLILFSIEHSLHAAVTCV